MKLRTATILFLFLLAGSCTAATNTDVPFQILFSFSTNTSEPRFPTGHLIEADNGNFYGTARGGGSTGVEGSIFQISKMGQFTVLHSFDRTNGSHPRGGLLRASDGDFYGVASDGGAFNQGTIYRITANGSFSTLYSLRGSTNGRAPMGLTQAADGNFYGMTWMGGTYGVGTIFKFSTNGVFKTLMSFSTSDGSYPYYRLLAGADGYLYGSTPAGGINNHGTLFRCSTNGTLTTLVFFNQTNGAQPRGDLIFGHDGDIYGVTTAGGAFGHGTIFKATTNGSLTTLVHFDGTNAAHPAAGLVQSREGYLYGTTSYRGVNYENYGTLFRMTTNGALTVLVQFDGTNGTRPFSHLIQGSDGSIYGAFSDAELQQGINGGTILRLNEQPIISSIDVNGSEATLTWHSFINRSYRVEDKFSPADSAWNILASPVLSQGNRTSFNVGTFKTAQRYFRVVLLP